MRHGRPPYFTTSSSPFAGQGLAARARVTSTVWPVVMARPLAVEDDDVDEEHHARAR